MMRRRLYVNLNTLLLTLVLGVATWTLKSVIQLREDVVGLQRGEAMAVERAGQFASDERELRQRVDELEKR